MSNVDILFKQDVDAADNAIFYLFSFSSERK